MLLLFGTSIGILTMNHSNIFVLTIYPLTGVFTWSSEDDLDVYIGGNYAIDTVVWEMGAAIIQNFGLDDINIGFYRDREATDKIQTTDDDYMIGDESLAEIITLENFVDELGGSGTVDVKLNPSGITVQELMTDYEFYFQLYVVTY